MSPDSATAEIAASRGRWRAQRTWLNQHRSELAQLAADLYPVEYRIPRTPLIAPPSWVPDEPVDLRSIALQLSEDLQTVALNGREPETVAVRPFYSPDVHFDCYTSAIRHLDPPRLFESRPSYRYLGGSLTDGRLDFGLAA